MHDPNITHYTTPSSWFIVRQGYHTDKPSSQSMVAHCKAKTTISCGKICVHETLLLKDREIFWKSSCSLKETFMTRKSNVRLQYQDEKIKAVLEVFQRLSLVGNLFWLLQLSFSASLFTDKKEAIACIPIWKITSNIIYPFQNHFLAILCWMFDHGVTEGPLQLYWSCVHWVRVSECRWPSGMGAVLCLLRLSLHLLVCHPANRRDALWRRHFFPLLFFFFLLASLHLSPRAPAPDCAHLKYFMSPGQSHASMMHSPCPAPPAQTGRSHS